MEMGVVGEIEGGMGRVEEEYLGLEVESLGVMARMMNALGEGYVLVEMESGERRESKWRSVQEIA